MSTQESPEATGSEELQFERAEYATPAGATTCVACKNAVSGTYYEVNGKVLCPRCRDAVEAHRRGGSGIARFARAALFGVAAAIAGFLIYYGVMKLAHMEIGLISILVGFMVGVAVRNGSRHRGGWPYQLLALVLTYSAIAASYSAAALPILLAQAREKGAGGPVPEAARPAAAKDGPAAEKRGTRNQPRRNPRLPNCLRPPRARRRGRPEGGRDAGRRRLAGAVVALVMVLAFCLRLAGAHRVPAADRVADRRLRALGGVEAEQARADGDQRAVRGRRRRRPPRSRSRPGKGPSHA